MNDSEIVLPTGQQVSTFFEDQRQTVRNFEATHGQAARGIDPVRGNLVIWQVGDQHQVQSYC